MKVIWLCNVVPGAVREKLGSTSGGGLWMDHVLSDLRKEGLSLRILCRGLEQASGSLDERTDFVVFPAGEDHAYQPELEPLFQQQLQQYQPDVIHIWGTEYGHTLAMVRAAKVCDMLPKIAVSIQGLCGPHTAHYAEGIPVEVQRSFTFRDFVRRDNILMQQKKFAQRGEMERQALEQVAHVIGRTDWDRACTMQINPKAAYHFCNETLRDGFYSGRWQYAKCRKRTIFASSCLYPIKGFHYLLEALAIVRRFYPDATVRVTGESFFAKSLSQKLRQESYSLHMQRICEKNDLTSCVEFLGSLNEQQMKQAFLDANVFVLPSTTENSPNSLGEAMLLGVPCVAADVGGVRNMMADGEGVVYQSTAPYMLAQGIMNVFAMEDGAERMGAAASAHAAKTHDPETNRIRLLEIYREIAG